MLHILPLPRFSVMFVFGTKYHSTETKLSKTLDFMSFSTAKWCVIANVYETGSRILGMVNNWWQGGMELPFRLHSQEQSVILECVLIQSKLPGVKL